MITTPDDVLQADEGVVGFAWDGTSPHPQYPDEEVPNKETTMDWAEHQRIVCAAGKLLVSWTTDQHTGNGKAAFKALKDAYDGVTNKGRSSLRVSKGIHQPLTNPHLQIRVVASFYNSQDKTTTNFNYTFHLNVSATEVTSDGLKDRFQWQPVQFSYEDANKWYRWPAVVTHNRKNSTTKRRASISYAALTEHLEALAEQEAERLRLEQIEQAKLVKSTLKEAIEADVARLATEGVILRVKPPKEPAASFWTGKRAVFTDKWGKKPKYMKWDPLQKKLVDDGI